MLADVKAVAKGEEKAAFNIALCLAFFNQAMASSAIINYAPRLLRDSGIRNETFATLLTSTVTAAKVALGYSNVVQGPCCCITYFPSLNTGMLCMS